MGILFSIFSLLALCGGVFFWSRQRREARGSGEVRQALDACELLLSLIKSMQLHRGMSSAWLAGDASFAPRMAQRQQEIGQRLAALLAVADRESAMPRPCLTRNDVTLFRHRWIELIESVPRLSTEQNIARHSQLIAIVVDWLAALGEARVQLACPDLTAGEVRNYADRLPALTECMGQARALGSAAAAKGVCPPVARVRLMFLAARLETLLAHAVGATESGQGKNAEMAVERLLVMIHGPLLGETRVGVTAATYFDTATAAIEAVYAWIEECGKRLNRDLILAGSAPLPTATAHA